MVFVDTEGKLAVARFASIARAKLPEVFGGLEEVESLMNRLLLLRPQTTAELLESLQGLDGVVSGGKAHRASRTYSLFHYSSIHTAWCICRRIGLR